MEGSGASYAVLGASGNGRGFVLVLPLRLLSFLLWPQICRVPSLRRTHSQKKLEQNGSLGFLR